MKPLPPPASGDRNCYKMAVGRGRSQSKGGYQWSVAKDPRQRSISRPSSNEVYSFCFWSWDWRISVPGASVTPAITHLPSASVTVTVSGTLEGLTYTLGWLPFLASSLRPITVTIRDPPISPCLHLASSHPSLSTVPPFPNGHFFFVHPTEWTKWYPRT